MVAAQMLWLGALRRRGWSLILLVLGEGHPEQVPIIAVFLNISSHLVPSGVSTGDLVFIRVSEECSKTTKAPEIGFGAAILCLKGPSTE